MPWRRMVRKTGIWNWCCKNLLYHKTVYTWEVFKGRDEKESKKESKEKGDIGIISEKSHNDPDATYGANGIDQKTGSERCAGIVGRRNA